ncbi:relaxase/mobilization nuclease domain-containing protein [Azohydromonas aeria]|uniref:relaxase/mobilization nuclease domain-containing protein n=1 Tax=Azohydromonas aeria TaxID=2590212 RepID=UPI0012F9A606|nr:relaxase/mobilization nuclease domain-containing protein [Azohydromonas aeria]
MGQPRVDGVLLEWGTRLFYEGPERGRAGEEPKLLRPRPVTARAIRARIRATVRRAPQVMVKIMSNQTGMKGVRRVLRYISHHGEIEVTDENGEVFKGMPAVLELGELFRCDTALIPEEGSRWRETLHIEMGMPAGTVDRQRLEASVREMLAAEFEGHKYAWAYHGHQKNPHLHIVVRTMGRDFKRLPTRKADLHRWRESFARELRSRGIEADASRRVVRGVVRQSEAIWAVKAREQGRLHNDRGERHGVTPEAMNLTLAAWGHVHNALAGSPDAADQALAREVKTFLAGTPMVQEMAAAREQARAQEVGRPGPEVSR